MGLTIDPKDPRLGHGVDAEPRDQHEVYLVLSAEDRAKGFVRPYRDTYRHVGEQPKNHTRPLTPEEHERYFDKWGYVAFEPNPEHLRGESSVTGRFWTAEQLANHGCGGETKMGRELSETYAAKPTFYGSTYCVHCRKHLPVAEFIWVADGQRVGS